jgi:hypothetical protein
VGVAELFLLVADGGANIFQKRNVSSAAADTTV